MKGRRLRQFATALAASQVHQLVRSVSTAVPTLSQRVDSAKKLREVYRPGFAFPSWSVEELESGRLEDLAPRATVYFPVDSDFTEVKKLVRQREPVNIAMKRLYDETKMQEYFGYSRGAYEQSSPEELLPNIAIYCKTPIRFQCQREEVHVINVIGFAFDSPQQPDYQHFLRNESGIKDLMSKMSDMWEYVFFCARKKHLDRVYLPNVGGGAFFAGLRHHYDYGFLKRESLKPVLKRYPDIEVLDLPMIPAWVFSNRQLLKSSLLVNAWDPWSMVGNGNEGDNSLDGFFGRSTAMALLCWPETNPYLSYEEVPPPHP